MKVFLGIDAGAVGVKAAVVVPIATAVAGGPPVNALSTGGTPSDTPAGHRCHSMGTPPPDVRSTVEAIEFPVPLVPLAHADGRRFRVWVLPYRRTRGRPLEAIGGVLEALLAVLPAESVRGMVLTGSGSTLASPALGARRVNEFQAIARAVGRLHPHVRTVFEMGGETSKFIRLEPDAGGTSLNIIDYGTNGDCAAGTGSFLDQQAGRLRYKVEEIGAVVEGAQRAAQIAGRCSVFAKSDMIHAQQKAFTPPEVLRGLCKAVAVNYRSAVVKGRTPAAPIALLGGVSANSAVVAELREAFGLADGDLFVPPAAESMAAIGAAIMAAEADAVKDSRSADGESPAASAATHGEDAAAPGLAHNDACVGCGNGRLSAVIGRLAEAAGADARDLPTSPPLDLSNVLLLRDQGRRFEFPEDGSAVDAYLGLDIGSVGTKLVVIDGHGAVIHEIFTRTEGRPIGVVSRCLRELEEAVGPCIRIRGVGTTGSGRELIGELVGADAVVDEITCHKTGATFVGDRLLGRRPDTIFEIGGQDSKYISLAPEGGGSTDTVVVDFTMNEACAAGTGSFLEERAAELGVSIKDEFARLALGSKAPIKLGERCTVFMERDVNTCMQRGTRREDVIAGLAYSVVYNYVNRVVRGRAIGSCIFFQGGTAYNDAVAAAFSKVCGRQVIVPPHNAVLGAIGAALVASEKMAATLEETRFRGFDMSAVDYTLKEFTCRGCGNTCSVQEFNVEGQKTYWGDKCSDRYRKRAKTSRQAVIPDLVALRHELMYAEGKKRGREAEWESGRCGERDLGSRLQGSGTSDPRPATPSNQPPTINDQRIIDKDSKSIGIPLAMYALDLLPLWRTFFRECGCRVVTSDPTDRRTIRAGLEASVAEPCFPIIVAHGHVADLVAKNVDYIWLPNILNAATEFMDNESHVCPWGQTLPFVARQAPPFQPWQNRILCPAIRFRDGPGSVREALTRTVLPLGVNARTARRAFEAAWAAQERFKSEYLRAGAEALEMLARTGEPGMVLVGRPYNVHDPGVNLAVARKLREYYGVNVIPIDALPLADVDIRDVNDNMFWEYGRKILAAARLVGRHPNLHIIYITNFKCGPDSFVKSFVDKAGGKPFLTLQFDGHSNDAGMMTRCEAYLDSKGILRWWRQSKSKPAAEVSRGGPSTSHKWLTPARGS